MKTFVIDVIGKFDISPDKTHVAGVVYSSDAFVVLKFNTFQRAQLNVVNVTRRFEKMRHLRGLTFIDKALLLADREIFTEAGGMRDDKPKVNSCLLCCLFCNLSHFFPVILVCHSNVKYC